MALRTGILLTFLLVANLPLIVKAESSHEFVVKWLMEIPGSGFMSSHHSAIPPGPLVITNGIIAPGTLWGNVPGNNTFIALDAVTGKIRWAIPLRNESGIFPATSDGKLIFAGYYDPYLPSGNQNRILAIDPLSGRIVWNVDQSSFLLAGNQIVSYIVPKGLVAYDASTGRLRWSSPTGGYTTDYGDGRLFVEKEAERHLPGRPFGPAIEHFLLRAYDASSGVATWTRIYINRIECARYANGAVFALESFWSGNNTQIVNLIALNASDGRSLWKRRLAFSITT